MTFIKLPGALFIKAAAVECVRVDSNGKTHVATQDNSYATTLPPEAVVALVEEALPLEPDYSELLERIMGGGDDKKQPGLASVSPIDRDRPMFQLRGHAPGGENINKWFCVRCGVEFCRPSKAGLPKKCPGCGWSKDDGS